MDRKRSPVGKSRNFPLIISSQSGPGIRNWHLAPPAFWYRGDCKLHSIQFNFLKQLTGFRLSLPEVFRYFNTRLYPDAGVRFACLGRRILISIPGWRKNFECELRETI